MKTDCAATMKAGGDSPAAAKTERAGEEERGCKAEPKENVAERLAADATNKSGAAHAPAPEPAPAAAESGNKCVICMTETRSWGAMHNGTLHKCYCTDCKNEVESRLLRGEELGFFCPVCRDPVEMFLQVFD